MKISRRRMVQTAVSAMAVARGGPAAASATLAEEQADARQRLEESLGELRKVRVDMALEPDFTFKA